MKTIYKIALAFIFMTSCTQESISEPSEMWDVKSVIKNKSDLNREKITVFGYVVIKFEKMNIYQSENDYLKTVSGFENESATEYVRTVLELCMGIDLDEYLYSRREALNQSYLTISGTVDEELCGDDEICNVFCNNYGLTNVEILTPDWEDGPIRIPNNRISKLFLVEESSEDYQQMSGVAQSWLQAVLDKNKDELVNKFYSPDTPPVMEYFEWEDSRLNWILFESKNSVYNIFKEKENIQIDVLKFSIEEEENPKEGMGVACFCKDGTCDTAKMTAFPYFQSFSSPYFCVLLTSLDDKLYVDFAQFE